MLLLLLLLFLLPLLRGQGFLTECVNSFEFLLKEGVDNAMSGQERFSVELFAHDHNFELAPAPVGLIHNLNVLSVQTCLQLLLDVFHRVATHYRLSFKVLYSSSVAW